MNLSKFLSAKLSTVIQKINYPQGRYHGQYSIVGSVPAACYDVEANRSKIYPTLAECCAAIEAAGVARYQMPDCSWNVPA